MNELFIQVIFYTFAGITLLSALMVISQSNPVRCVLSLVLTFFASAVLWMLLTAEFLSLILVLVYVGAVMTLFLFVVMMLNVDSESKRMHLFRYLPFGLILVALLTGLLLVAIPEDLFHHAVEKKERVSVIDMTSEEPDFYISSLKAVPNSEKIGLVLYTDYVLAFEIAAILLLVAIIAAITLVHRGTIRSKRQCIKKQLMTNPKERIVMVSMNSDRSGNFHDTSH